MYNYPCSCCKKPVRTNQKALKCTGCNMWLHIICANIPTQKYNDPSEQFFNWRCNMCLLKELPFHLITSTEKLLEEKSHNEKKFTKHSASVGLNYQEFNGNGLKIAHLNVNSVLKHIDEIKSLLICNNIHILALNETKIDSSIFDSEVNIDNYSFLRKDRSRHGGGVAIYVHKSLHFETLNHESMNDLEVLAIKIFLKKAKPIICTTWYRPPSLSVEAFNLYEDVLIYLDSLSTDTILMGDTNCDLLANPVSCATKRFIEINDLYAFVNLNKSEPTRITDVSATLVDHVLTNSPENVKKCGVIHNGMSDHSICYLIWNTSVPSSPKLTSFRSCKNLDADEFRKDVSNLPLEKLAECKTIDDAVNFWQDNLMNLIDKHMPTRIKRVRERNSPWMTSHLFKLMKKRDKIKKKAYARKDEKLMGDYRKLRNKVNAETVKAKKRYYSDKLAQSNDPKNTWKTLKSFMPNKKGNTAAPVNPDNDAKIANKFNSFFAEVGSNLAKHMQNTHIDHDTHTDLDNAQSIDNVFEFKPVNESQVTDIIRNLRNTKATGLDEISVFVLKLCASELSPSIAYLINLPLKSGKFPTQWKKAKIIPIHKSGDKDNPSNFRPISILPCVSKILERVVQRQIIAFLHENNLLSPAQSGFRPRHSTMSTLIKVTDDWLHAMDKKECTGTIFVDLKKAFDTVDWDILIGKINKLGITGLPSLWIKSYLSDRVSRTLVNNELSAESVITCGVPQGSLLGPLLFIIYINDLVDSVKTCKIQLYADDTVLYFSHRSSHIIQQTLQTELENVNKWMSRNKLTVNCQKTVCMLLGS